MLDWLYRTTWVLLAVLVIIGLSLIFMPRIAQYREYRRREGLRAEAVRETEDAIQNLRRQQELFRTDPRYAERIAHDLGMARTNEVLYRIIDSRPRRED